MLDEVIAEVTLTPHHHLFVSTPSEEILAIRRPVTGPDDSTVHRSDFVGEGKKTENRVVFELQATKCSGEGDPQWEVL